MKVLCLEGQKKEKRTASFGRKEVCAMEKEEPLEEHIQHLAELPLLLLTGGVGYYAAELLWRGHSHWSMSVCGAVCFLFIYRLNQTYPHARLWLRALQSALFITAVELAAGCLLNRWLGLGIWDYSGLPCQFLGQICLPYSALWFAISIPLCWLCRLMRRRIFLEDD